jgi:type I restriction enzyme S subunit
MNLLPDGWSVVKIQDLTIHAKQRDPSKNPDKPFRYVDVSSVSNTLFKIETATEMLGSKAPSRARKEIKAKDILFATVRPTLKRIALVPQELDGEIASTGYCVLRPQPDKVVPEFLYHSLLTNSFVKAMGALEHGVSYPAIRDTDVFSALISLPPIDEQRRIAYVLTTVQTAIEQQARMIALTHELKSALMKKLFSEGLRGEKQKETEIGLVPEEWETESLASLFTIKHGFGFKGEYFKPEGTYILLTPGHFHEEGGFRDQKEKTKFYTGKIPDGFILQEGDLLIAMTEQKAGLLGSSIIVPESSKYLHNQRLGLIQNLDNRIDKDFLFYYFNTSYPRREIFSTATGSKVRHTSPSKVLSLKIAFPKIDEQKKIAAILKAVDQKLTLLKNKKLLFEELFRTLLHQLMRGEVRTADLRGFEDFADGDGADENRTADLH